LELKEEKKSRFGHLILCKEKMAKPSFEKTSKQTYRSVSYSTWEGEVFLLFISVMAAGAVRARPRKIEPTSKRPQSCGRELESKIAVRPRQTELLKK